MGPEECEVEVRCACGNSQQIADNAFESHGSVQVKCSACGQTYRVVSPKTLTLKAEITHKPVPDITSFFLEDGRKLCLPKNKSLSLKTLAGAEKGTVYAVAKPRITLGRANADVTIDDPLASRLHCVIEAIEEWVQLRDLGSTNGTLVNGKPVKAATLGNGSTFRVGNHIFELRISPKEE
jgi:FHA domain-containing protein